MKTSYEIAEEVAAEVAATGYGSADLERVGDGWRLTLTTGGWSDAEEIIHNLSTHPAYGGRSTARWLWRTTTWETIERGGRFTFADDRCDRVILDDPACDLCKDTAALQQVGVLSVCKDCIDHAAEIVSPGSSVAAKKAGDTWPSRMGRVHEDRG